MDLFETDRFTDRPVWRVLALGFALVLALLGLAGYVAVRSTRAIEADAADVAQEQLVMAQLLTDVQAGQHALAAILYRLSPRAEVSFDRASLLAELEGADRALAQVATAAARVPEAPLWRELEDVGRRFSTAVRRTLAEHDRVDAEGIEPLFTLHDQMAQVAQRLLTATERRLEDTERSIAIESRDLAFNARLLLGASLLIASLCAVLTVAFARRSIRKIEDQASELGRVSWHLLQSQESQARRFAHELHDELGQSLAAVKANLNASSAAEWVSRRTDSLQQVDSAIANVRELSQLLHPVMLDDFGLDAALRWLTDGFSQRTGVAMAYTSDFHGRMDDDTETHLFRIAQEALTNVARHSRATRVQVDLREQDGCVRMTIEDNGRGLTDVHGVAPPSLGMTGMRARAREIGGRLGLVTPEGGGFRIVLDAPLRPPRDEPREDHDSQLEEARAPGG